jgi:DNA-binding CsgD family transcriptional regulator
MHFVSRVADGMRAAADWYAADHVDELAQQVCGNLSTLIRADGVGWNELDLRRKTIRIAVHPPDYFPGSHARLAELIHENPLVELRAETGGAADTFWDFITPREFHKREIYGDVYRVYGVEDQLAAFFDAGRDILIAVAFNRGRRDFTAADRRLLDILCRHVQGAYRRIEDRQAGQARFEALERGLGSLHAGVVLVSANGELDHASPLHAAWFAPREVPTAGIYYRSDAQLTVRVVPGRPEMLLLDEQRLTPDPETVRRLGLTPREAEVVTLAGRGMSNSEIATALVVAERTVHKHLEHAFEKLGVHSRVAAARMLLSDRSLPGDDL